jgi:hypothetical protein
VVGVQAGVRRASECILAFVTRCWKQARCGLTVAVAPEEDSAGVRNLPAIVLLSNETRRSALQSGLPSQVFHLDMDSEVRHGT